MFMMREKNGDGNRVCDLYLRCVRPERMTSKRFHPGPAPAKPILHMSLDKKLEETLARVEKGGAPEVPREERRERASSSPASASPGSSMPGSFVEDAALANALDAELPADGVITGIGDASTAAPCAIMANDSTVKAGSWGARTVEKILRIQETARDAPRARSSTWSTRPARASPIRSTCSPAAAARGASSTTRCSCRAGAADLPALRPVGGGRRVHPGVLRRRLHGRQERQHVPRLAAHGRDGHRREGDARGDGRRAMHCSVSGCGDVLVKTEEEAIAFAQRYLALLAAELRASRRRVRRRAPPKPSGKRIDEIIPADENKPFDMMRGHRRDHRRGQLLRDQEALRARDRHRLRAHRRARRRHRRQPAEVARAACSSSTRPTRRRASSGCATRSTCRCSTSPTCPAS